MAKIGTNQAHVCLAPADIGLQRNHLLVLVCKSNTAHYIPLIFHMVLQEVLIELISVPRSQLLLDNTFAIIAVPSIMEYAVCVQPEVKMLVMKETIT